MNHWACHKRELWGILLVGSRNYFIIKTKNFNIFTTIYEPSPTCLTLKKWITFLRSQFATVLFFNHRVKCATNRFEIHLMLLHPFRDNWHVVNFNCWKMTNVHLITNQRLANDPRLSWWAGSLITYSRMTACVIFCRDCVMIWFQLWSDCKKFFGGFCCKKYSIFYLSWYQTFPKSMNHIFGILKKTILAAHKDAFNRKRNFFPLRQLKPWFLLAFFYFLRHPMTSSLALHFSHSLTRQ